jgi:hypothetical protein
MRITLLIVLLCLVFVVALMWAEPHHPAVRIYLFPGLAIAFGMVRALGMNLAGRATFVWALATLFNTLLYSAMTLASFWLTRRFWPGRRTS